MMTVMRIAVSACLIGLALSSAALAPGVGPDEAEPAPAKRALDTDVFDAPRKHVLDTDVFAPPAKRKLDTDVFARRAIDTDVFDEQPASRTQPKRLLDADVFR